MSRETRKIIQEVEYANPAAQATTNSYADVTGSLVDTFWLANLSYTILNSHASKDLDWKVLASNDGDNFVEVQAEETLQQQAFDSYVANPAVYRYYKIQVKSTVADQASEATISVMAK